MKGKSEGCKTKERAEGGISGAKISGGRGEDVMDLNGCGHDLYARLL